jgi:hypothetical protein
MRMNDFGSWILQLKRQHMYLYIILLDNIYT